MQLILPLSNFLRLPIFIRMCFHCDYSGIGGLACDWIFDFDSKFDCGAFLNYGEHFLCILRLEISSTVSFISILQQQTSLTVYFGGNSAILPLAALFFVVLLQLETLGPFDAIFERPSISGKVFLSALIKASICGSFAFLPSFFNRRSSFRFYRGLIRLFFRRYLSTKGAVSRAKSANISHVVSLYPFHFILSSSVSLLSFLINLCPIMSSTTYQSSSSISFYGFGFGRFGFSLLNSYQIFILIFGSRFWRLSAMDPLSSSGSFSVSDGSCLPTNA